MGAGRSAIDRRRRRTAGVVVVSAVVHGLLLLVLGSQIPNAHWRIRSLDQDAVQAVLVRPPPPPKPPKPILEPKTLRPETERPPEPKGAAAPVTAPLPPPPPPTTVPHLIPPPPAAAAPAAPAPAAKPAAPAAGRPSPWLVGPGSVLPPGFSTSLRTQVGCSDPKAAGLSREEREACEKRLARGARDAPFIQAPMAPEKRAAYDRVIKCRKEYDDAPVPNSRDSAWGLGYVPRLRDCGPGDH